jgi:uncharacterized membrane protein
MNFVAGGGIENCATEHVNEYVHIARRNNSLSSIGRRFVFGFILTVSLGIAVAFSLVFGAWPIMPFAGIEMVVLYLAFRCIDRHADDYERITIRGDSVAVEIREGSRVTRHELNRCWAQVVCEPGGARLALRSHGREVALGRHANDEQRVGVARELARELKGAVPEFPQAT